MTVNDNEEYVTVQGYENDRVPLRVKMELDAACAAVDAAKERREAARAEFDKYAGRTLSTVRYEAEQAARHEEYVAQRRTAPMAQRIREKLKNNRFKVQPNPPPSFVPGDIVWFENNAPARVFHVNGFGEIALHWPGQRSPAIGGLSPGLLKHASASNPRVENTLRLFAQGGVEAQARG